MHLSSIESIGQAYQHIYVSPHMDDVALSCGGRIIRQRRRGESVLVVTVFTSDIDSARKPQYGRSDPYTNTQRRWAEDKRAMERLGVDYLWLDYPDVLYRHRHPFIHYSLHFRGLDADTKLREALLGDLLRIGNASSPRRWYFPFGVGQHLDHRIVFEVGAQLWRRGMDSPEMCFYEDTPYVLFPNALKYRMVLVGADIAPDSPAKDLTRRTPILQEVKETYDGIMRLPSVKLNHPLLRGTAFFFLLFSISLGIYILRPRGKSLRGTRVLPEIEDISSAIEDKLGAIEEYRSQIKALVGDIDTLRSSLDTYAIVIGGSANQSLERYWKIVR